MSLLTTTISRCFFSPTYKQRIPRESVLFYRALLLMLHAETHSTKPTHKQLGVVQNANATYSCMRNPIQSTAVPYGENRFSGGRPLLFAPATERLW